MTLARIPAMARQALINVLKGIMLGDYGHDLPDIEFYAEADLIIARLEAAGYRISRTEAE